MIDILFEQYLWIILDEGLCCCCCLAYLKRRNLAFCIELRTFVKVPRINYYETHENNKQVNGVSFQLKSKVKLKVKKIKETLRKNIDWLTDRQNPPHYSARHIRLDCLDCGLFSSLCSLNLKTGD